MLPTDHPYRSLYVPAIPEPPSRPPQRDVRVALGVLIAVSVIQLVSGAQVVAGALGLAGGAAGLLSTWRPRWTISSSSS